MPTLERVVLEGAPSCAPTDGRETKKTARRQTTLAGFFSKAKTPNANEGTSKEDDVEVTSKANGVASPSKKKAPMKKAPTKKTSPSRTKEASGPAAVESEGKRERVVDLLSSENEGEENSDDDEPEPKSKTRDEPESQVVELLSSEEEDDDATVPDAPESVERSDAVPAEGYTAANVDEEPTTDAASAKGDANVDDEDDNAKQVEEEPPSESRDDDRTELDEPSSAKGSGDAPAIKRGRAKKKRDPAPPVKKTTLTPSELSEELRTLHRAYSIARAKSAACARELAERGIDGEYEPPALPARGGDDGEVDDDGYSDRDIECMAVMVESSHLPLSQLIESVKEALEKRNDDKSFKTEVISEKIKAMAKRKDTFSAPGRADIFEDTEADRFWRWEIISIDLLPSDLLSKAKKARSTRSRLSKHHGAVMKLVKSLDTALAKICQHPPVPLDKFKADVSRDEERVLKFTRQAEKARLAEVAKRKRQEELEQKKLEKEAEVEKKRLEKERKKIEAAEAKAQAKRKREEEKQNKEGAKRTKQVEMDSKKQQMIQEKQQKEEAVKKQKACLMSFFGVAKKASSPSKNPEVAAVAETIPEPVVDAEPAEIVTSKSIEKPVDDFNVREFRRAMNSTSEFPPAFFSELSGSARRSRKRRTRKVRVSVFVTSIPDGADNPFSAQPYAEERVLTIPNKKRFLLFREDYRPPYWGTWSKTSSIVSGRNPFAKDPEYLDYDVDSEAEWEEGDDEIGEDVEDEEKNKEEEDDMEDEEGDTTMYNYKDGFCVADDEYLNVDGEADEETRLLYEKKLKSADGPTDAKPNLVRIIAPMFGGVPFQQANNNPTDRVDGLEPKMANEILEGHRGSTLCDCDLDVNAYERSAIESSDTPPNTEPKKSTAYTQEQLQAFARFVHHNTLNSKEKIVSELQIAHPDTFDVRTKAIRHLDSIALKKRRAKGVYWEVKPEIRTNLGLFDQLPKDYPEELLSPPPPSEKPTTPTAKSSSPNILKPRPKPKGTKAKSPPKPSASPKIYSLLAMPPASVSTAAPSALTKTSGVPIEKPKDSASAVKSTEAPTRSNATAATKVPTTTACSVLQSTPCASKAASISTNLAPSSKPPTKKRRVPLTPVVKSIDESLKSVLADSVMPTKKQKTDDEPPAPQASSRIMKRFLNRAK